MDKDQIKEKLKSYFKEYSDYQPEDDEDLFESGTLDSFGIVEFLTFLQEELHADVEIEDITMENFSTLNKIIELISP